MKDIMSLRILISAMVFATLLSTVSSWTSPAICHTSTAPTCISTGSTTTYQNFRSSGFSILRSTSMDVEAVSAREEKESKEIDEVHPPEPQIEDELQLEMKDKVINGLFLSMAFGYALYTIFSIDSGITRGWTGSEIAMRIPLDNWGAYESYLANKPIVTKTLINVIIYLLGDWLSQTVFQSKNVLEFDIKRTFRNGFIGLCFGPLVHEYYQFSDSILPPENGLVTRLEKILMDQTIYLTVKCSIYISAVGLLSGNDWSTVQQTVKEKIGGIVITAWKFWPLIHCITYGLVPARHRILWVNSVDLVWNAILASMASKAQKDVSVDEAVLIEEIMGIDSTDDHGGDGIFDGNSTALHIDQDSVMIDIEHTNLGEVDADGGCNQNLTENLTVSG